MKCPKCGTYTYYNGGECPHCVVNSEGDKASANVKLRGDVSGPHAAPKDTLEATQYEIAQDNSRNSNYPDEKRAPSEPFDENQSEVNNFTSSGTPKVMESAVAEVPKTVSLRDAFAITIKMFSELREEHDALKAERARYRKALEHIHEESAGWAAMIAREALEAGDGK